MTQDEAEEWCRDHNFDHYWFKMPDQGTPGKPMITGRKLWSLSGWAWNKKGTEKERIHYAGEKLEELVERAKQRVEWKRTT